ncbi:hypothetical protein DdX_08558 [Ditylenchus destructor]|uniref:Uncharacterized protein n=1 Tax=Ditylenchus destructor TaxID=166010 RepID=A0AAD4N7K8_9BILA|nr:hypothetical protein DdX_08558 [Ditylenchus destructor]
MLSELSRIKFAILNSPDTIDDRFVGDFVKLFSNSQIDLRVDSLERRLILLIIEKILQNKWSVNNYRQVPASDFHLCALGLTKLANEIVFSTDVTWFGGTVSNEEKASTSTDSSVEQSCEEMIQYISIITLSIASLDPVKIPVYATQNAAKFLSVSLCNKSITRFVDILLENDERCLYTILSLLEMHKQNSAFNDLDPVQIFFTLLIKINFDIQVVIDWLQSETVAIPFLMRFLKLLAKMTKEELEERLNKLTPANKYAVRPARLCRKTITEAGPKIDSFVFEIEELHGEQNVLKSVEVSASPWSFQSEPKEAIHENDDTSNAYERFSDFVSRMRVQLQKLKKLMPFNTDSITRVLLSIEDVLDN